MWNPVMNFVNELKALYIEQNGKISYDYEGYPSVIHMWAANVKNYAYQCVINNLYINQWGDYCLLKYANYVNLYSDYDFEEVWTMWDGFYRSCRSVVVNVVRGELVLTPYDKFFNINELKETSVENVAKAIASAKSVEFTDKMDGSLQSARFYNGNVILTGSSAIDPEGESAFRVRNGYTFLKHHEKYIEMLKDYSNYTFIFESIMPDDPHIVIYSEYGLWLTGARNVIDGKLMSHKELNAIAQKYSAKITESYDMSFEEILADRSKHPCSEKEGFVAKIDDFFVKIKCDDFLNLHSLLSGLRANSNMLGNNLIKAMNSDTLDDFLSAIPAKYKNEVEPTLETIRTYMCVMQKRVLSAFADCMYNSTDIKSFMEYSEKNVSKDILGMVRAMKTNKPINYLKSGQAIIKFSAIKKYLGMETEDAKESMVANM